MAQSSLPFDGQTTTETQFSNFFRELQDTGVCASADSLALKVTADAGGMRVFLGTGSAIVRGFFYNNDASLQLTIAAAHATLARVDRVVLRLDPSANSIVAAVITGTPGAGAPAVTQSTTGIYELPLATVSVAAAVTTIASGNVTDTRTFIGRGVTSWTTSTRPASPRKGALGYNSTTSAWEFWDGAAWAALVPGLDWASLTGKPSTFTPAAHTHSGPQIVSGQVAFDLVGASTQSQTYSFGVGVFAAAPRVVVTQIGTTNFICSVSAVDASSFTLNVRQYQNTPVTTSFAVGFIAVRDDVAGAID